MGVAGRHRGKVGESAMTVERSRNIGVRISNGFRFDGDSSIVNGGMVI